MLRPLDYLILQIHAQVVKIITVACNPYYKVPVLFRMFLRISQGISAHYIELNMMTFEGEIAPYKRRKALKTILVAEE